MAASMLGLQCAAHRLYGELEDEIYVGITCF
jgi:hypothetical protein